METMEVGEISSEPGPSTQTNTKPAGKSSNLPW